MLTARLHAYRIGYRQMPRWKVYVLRLTWRVALLGALSVVITMLYSEAGVL